ncbi:MAG TPA: hypothetical protein VN397_01555 [Candidatus Methylomirabilis sp.]|nr:hypothetical protein [Candidatus Methylomirabilis sp.]
MASDEDKDKLFKLLKPLAIRQTSRRRPSPEEIATAASLLAEGLHPFDAIKTLRGQSFAEAAALVYAAVACRGQVVR